MWEKQLIFTKAKGHGIAPFCQSMRSENGYALSRGHGKFPSVPKPESAAEIGGNDSVSQLSVSPGNIHGIAAPGPQTPDAARMPGGGQGGQQPQEALMALQQHFGHTGAVAEVAVDLEDQGRMEVKQVGQQTLGQHQPYVFPGQLAVQ